MIKKRLTKKIVLALLSFSIILLVCLFPNGSDKSSYVQNVEYKDIVKSSIYLKDSYNRVGKTVVANDKKDINSIITNLISTLTINSSTTLYTPSGFYPLIPRNTKLLSLDLNNGLLKLNFSKEFLSVSKDDEEMMIESIVYTLTELNEVSDVMIFVNDQLLTKLPNSKKKLPIKLNRNYGINKIYDITSFSNIDTTTVYFYSNQNNVNYYVPVSIISSDEVSKMDVIINNLKSYPIYQESLISTLVSSVELLDYEVNESSASLNFNSYIMDSFSINNLSEEVKYSLYYSIKDSFKVDKVTFLINGEKIDELGIEK